MKRIVLIFMSIILVFLIAACTPQTNTPNADTDTSKQVQGIGAEERQRIDLYVSVMKAAYNVENGGSKFIAVRLDTLEGLSDNGKDEVLKELSSLSENVYDFEEVKNDSTKFELDKNGNLVRSIDGSLLSIYLKEYSKDKAVITGISWFGNLGAVFPEYEASYENGSWTLKLIGMAIS